MDVSNLRRSRAQAPAEDGTPRLTPAGTGVRQRPDTLEILGVEVDGSGTPAATGAGYAVFPSRETPRLLLPTTSAAAAARAMQLRYNGQRPLKARALRAAAALALRAGVLRHMSGSGVTDAVPSPALGALSEHLSGLLGEPVLLGTRLRRLDPHQSQVMLALSATGDRLAYVKIAWNDLTRQLLDAEEAGLRRCAQSRPRSFRAPDVIARSAFGGLDLLITRPMALGVSPLRPRLNLPAEKVLAELACVGTPERAALADSAYWAAVGKRVDALSASCGPDLGLYLEDRAKAVVEVAGSRPIRFGGWHGDLVPWNYAQRRGTVHVWDWEYWQDSAPLGLEQMQYVFGRQFFAAGRRAGEAARTALATPPGGQDGEPGQHSIAGLCFVLELVLRRLAITAAGGGQDDNRAFPDLFLLLDRLVHEGGVAVTAPWPTGTAATGSNGVTMINPNPKVSNE